MKKRCCKCKEFKPLDMFGSYNCKNAKTMTPDGLKRDCKKCRNEQERIRRICYRIKNHFMKLYPEYYEKNNNKTCSKCKKAKDINQFSKSKSTYDGFYPYCKKCDSIVSSKFRQDNKEHIYKTKKAYNEKQNKELGDYYVKQCLLRGTILKSKDIPQEVVEAKRDHLKLKRIIREEK